MALQKLVSTSFLFLSGLPDVASQKCVGPGITLAAPYDAPGAYDSLCGVGSNVSYKNVIKSFTKFPKCCKNMHFRKVRQNFD